MVKYLETSRTMTIHRVWSSSFKYESQSIEVKRLIYCRWITAKVAVRETLHVMIVLISVLICCGGPAKAESFVAPKRKKYV